MPRLSLPPHYVSTLSGFTFIYSIVHFNLFILLKDNNEEQVMYATTGMSKKEARKNAEVALLNDGRAIKWNLKWNIMEGMRQDGSHRVFLATPIGILSPSHLVD